MGSLRQSLQAGLLHQRMEAPGGGSVVAVDLPALLDVALEVAEAVTYLHSIRLCHCDIKVRVCARARARVCVCVCVVGGGAPEATPLISAHTQGRGANEACHLEHALINPPINHPPRNNQTAARQRAAQVCDKPAARLHLKARGLW